jgi:hypothetical protein
MRPRAMLLTLAILGVVSGGAAPARPEPAAAMVVSLAEMTATGRLLPRSEFRCGPHPDDGCAGFALLEAEDGERRFRVTARLLGPDRARIVVAPAEEANTAAGPVDDPGASGEVALDSAGRGGATLPLVRWNCPQGARRGDTGLLLPRLCPATRILGVLRVEIRFAAGA